MRLRHLKNIPRRDGKTWIQVHVQLVYLQRHNRDSRNVAAHHKIRNKTTRMTIARARPQNARQTDRPRRRGVADRLGMLEHHPHV